MNAVTILVPIIAAAAAQREGLLRRLRVVDAASADYAVALQFDGGVEPPAFAELLRTGEVRRTADGLYWADEERIAALAKREVRTATKWAFGLLGVALTGLGVAILANR